MTILIIDNDLYDIPLLNLEGTMLDAGGAAALRELYLSRCIARWRTWMKQNPQASIPQAQAAIRSIVENFKFDKPSDDGDVIDQEALVIARTLIEQRMTARGLPIPRNLDEHAKVLALSPEILQRARVIVQAKLEVNQKLLGEIT